MARTDESVEEAEEDTPQHEAGVPLVLPNQREPQEHENYGLAR